MKTTYRLLLALVLGASVAAGQQQNTPNASMTFDFQNGPPWPVTYTLSAASFAPIHLLRLEVSGAPDKLFTIGLAPGGLDLVGKIVTGVGIVNLNFDSGLIPLIDGFGLFSNPLLALSAYAITGSTGSAVLNLGIFPGWANHIIAAQTLIADPTSPTFLNLTTATLLNITP